LSPADITASGGSIIDYLIQVSIIILTGYFVWLAFPKKEVSGNVSR